MALEQPPSPSDPDPPEREVIRQLDPLVANQIAAGEVVERPSSVVKELVENSLDAGATRVDVKVEEGGRRRIVIADNGCGMSAADAPRAFARHATSKIAAASDLMRVGSYGFRGEALASILSVARVTLRSRREADEIGVVVRGDGSTDLEIKPGRAPVGTEIEVADLFFNVPARLKFLRTSATELGHILRFLDALALARPKLHLRLWHNGKKLMDHQPAQTLAERAASVLDDGVAEHLYPIAGDGPYGVDGLLSDPQTSRGSPRGLTFVVDGRPVQDKTLRHAVLQAYGTLLERRRYPVGVVRLRCPPGVVDVNVHPAKTEVRFVSSQAVHRAVGHAVRQMLAATPWLDAALAAAAPTVAYDSGDAAPERQPPPPAPAAPSPPQRLTWGRPAAPLGSPHRPAAGAPAAGPAPAYSRAESPPEAGGGADRTASTPSPAAELGRYGHLRYVGQVGRCFLVFDSDERFVVMDQHAAHERVLFERFVRAFRADGFPSQRLLIPRVVPLGPDASARLLEASDLLGPLGFEVAAAGERAVMVRAYPNVLRPGQIDEEIRDLASSLLDGGRGASTTERLERAAATLACHAAVRAGDVVRPHWVEGLLEAMADIDLAGYCPHGRPALLAADFDHVGRWFERS